MTMPWVPAPTMEMLKHYQGAEMNDPTLKKTNPYHQAYPEGTKVPDQPAAPAKPTRPWLDELKVQIQIADPEERAKRMAVLLAGRPIKTPDGWMGMSLEQKAEYLDKNYPLEVE